MKTDLIVKTYIYNKLYTTLYLMNLLSEQLFYRR